MKAAKSSGKCTLQMCRKVVRVYVVRKPLYDDDFENKMLSEADCNKF